MGPHILARAYFIFEFFNLFESILFCQFIISEELSLVQYRMSICWDISTDRTNNLIIPDSARLASWIPRDGLCKAYLKIVYLKIYTHFTAS